MASRTAESGVNVPARVCVRCRRIKTKCAYDDGQAKCRACHRGGYECVFVSKADRMAAKRRRTTSTADASQTAHASPIASPGGEAERRSHSVVSDTPAPACTIFAGDHEEPLSAELLATCQDSLHKYLCPFGPFHWPTLRKQLANGTVEKSLYYAILASGMRASPKFSAPFGSPLAASDHYMDKSRQHVLRNLDCPSLADVQALLLSVLLDWGSSRGTRAFMYLGMVARMALTHLPQTEHYDRPLSTAEFLAAETTRRTIWMAFMVEQFMCSGRGRYPVLRADELRISLPCAEMDFLFGIPSVVPMFDGSYPHISRRPAPSFVSTSSAPPNPTSELASAPAPASASLPQSSSTSSSPPPSPSPSSIWTASSSTRQTAPLGKESEFGSMAKIANIWHEVVTSRSRQSLDANNNDRPVGRQLLSELETMLFDWRAALPSMYVDKPTHLALHISLGTGIAYGFIHCVFNCARILLHREHLYYAYSQAESPAANHTPRRRPSEPDPSSRDVRDRAIETIFLSAERIIEILTTLDASADKGGDTVAFFPIFMLYSCFTASSAVAYLSIKQWTHSRKASFRIVREGLRILRSMKANWPLLEEWHSMLSSMVKVLQDRVMGLDTTTATTSAAVEMPSLGSLQYGHVRGALSSASTAARLSLSQEPDTPLGTTPDTQAGAVPVAPGPKSSSRPEPGPDVYAHEGFVLSPANATDLAHGFYFDLDQFLHTEDSLSAFLG